MFKGNLHKLCAVHHDCEIVEISDGKSDLRGLNGESFLRKPLNFKVWPSGVRGKAEVKVLGEGPGIHFESDEYFTVFGGGDKIGFKTRVLEISNESVTAPQEPIDLSKDGLALYQE